MTMTPAVRKFALTAHVTSSVGWFGALLVFLAHSLVSLHSQDDQMIRAAALAMAVTVWFVIMPLSLASLVTGIVQALGTAWGLLRHYWVMFKLLLTSIATLVLLLKLAPMSALADAAAQATFSRVTLVELKTSLLIHAVGGLVVLLAIATLAIFKPAGLTPYGLRKRGEEHPTQSAAEPTEGAPTWVKPFGGIVLMLVLIVVAMVVAGGHGPGAHAP